MTQVTFAYSPLVNTGQVPHYYKELRNMGHPDAQNIED